MMAMGPNCLQMQDPGPCSRCARRIDAAAAVTKWYGINKAACCVRRIGTAATAAAAATAVVAVAVVVAVAPTAAGPHRAFCTGRACTQARHQLPRVASFRSVRP